MQICPDCGEDLLDVQRLRLEPGDILVLNLSLDAPPLSPDREANLRRCFDDLALRNTVLLMQGGITLSVLKEAEPKPN